MSLPRIAARRPVLTAAAFALSQFLLVLAILLAGKALLPPELFGRVKLAAFASTVLLPLALVHAFGLWKEVGFDAGKVRPAPVFLVSLLLVPMSLALGVHVRPGSDIATDLAIQFFNAFGEELLFRGLVFLILLRLPVWQAIALNGVLFGSMHLLHGFMEGHWDIAARQAVFTSLGGALFAAVRYRTGSLWLAIALHMLKNLAVMYSNLGTAAGPQAESIAQGVTVVLELLVVGYVIAAMRRPLQERDGLPS
jgi:membrane protease YdiL (CAAX protease family)